MKPRSRRDLLRDAAAAAVAIALPLPLGGCARRAVSEDEAPEPELQTEMTDSDRERLLAWTAVVRNEGLARHDVPLGGCATRVGELATGTPYEAFTLEEYLRAGGSPSRTEPLALSLTRFDCVTLVEACLAVSRLAASRESPEWGRFGSEMERMRYRGGLRAGYTSRLHYFSEWIGDGERRGLVRDMGVELGGVNDERPLRFMTEHRDSYPALADDAVFAEIGKMERSLDGRPRHMIPTARIAGIADRIQSGDIVAFATSIAGLDVSHAAFAYRDSADVLRVLHAPLSGGVVEITGSTLPQYVAAIRRATGILVARPLWG